MTDDARFDPQVAASFQARRRFAVIATLGCLGAFAVFVALVATAQGESNAMAIVPLLVAVAAFLYLHFLYRCPACGVALVRVSSLGALWPVNLPRCPACKAPFSEQAAATPALQPLSPVEIIVRFQLRRRRFIRYSLELLVVVVAGYVLGATKFAPAWLSFALMAVAVVGWTLLVSFFMRCPACNTVPMVWSYGLLSVRSRVALNLESCPQCGARLR